MAHRPASRAPASSRSRVLKIDRVVLLSVVAGTLLAILSSVGPEVGGEREDPPATPDDGEATSFP